MPLHPDQRPPDSTSLLTPHSHHLPSLPPAHHMHTTSPSPHPPPHFYDHRYSASAKIAHLEAELEKARVEIERLKLKLVDVEKERVKADSPKVQSRYWTPHEHKRFLEALQKFGPKDVRAIANYVGSRNATQVRTHAQKYFLRVAREAKQGTSALQAARKRSMSESDLARVGRGVRTPPGSPNMRENKMMGVGSTPPPTAFLPPVQGDTQMTPVSLEGVGLQASTMQSSGMGGGGGGGGGLVFGGGQKVEGGGSLSSGAKPPVGVGKLSDNTGINLLSMVATEQKMEVEKGTER